MNTEHQLFKTAIFVFLEMEDKYFYLRRANTGWNDGKLTVPAGHVDKGETTKQAAVREAKEEAGVKIKEDDLEFVQVQVLKDNYHYFYFKTTKWEGEPIVNEPDLASEGLWVAKDDVREDLIPYLKVAIENIKKGKFFAEVGPDLG